jgi:hypothetical protein
MPNENRSFAGKVAFVTGAANGIGRALEGRQDGVFLEALATLVGASVAGFGTRPGTHLSRVPGDQANVDARLAVQVTYLPECWHQPPQHGKWIDRRQVTILL